MKISIKNILENIPKDLSNIEKVRYIYLEIGNIFSYQRDYIYATDYRFSSDMYKNVITIDMIEKGNYEDKIVSTCKQLSEVESEGINSLKHHNIQARTVGYNEDKESHVAVVVTIDGKNYFLDINLDLYKIQKKMKTVGFAKAGKALDGTECEIISDEELKRIDKKLGYCKYDMYMDDVIEMLKKEIMDEETLKQYMQEYIENSSKDELKEDVIYRYKLDFIFKYLKNSLSENEKIGSIEMNKYYQAIFKRLFTDEEKKNNKIKLYDTFIKNGGKDRKESILYEVKMRDRKLYYLYLGEQNGFIQKSVKELKYMHKNRQLEYTSKYFIPEFEFEEEIR